MSGFFDRSNVRESDLAPFPPEAAISYMQMQYYHFSTATSKGVDKKVRIECWSGSQVIKAATGNQSFTRWVPLRKRDAFVKMIRTQAKRGTISKAYCDFLLGFAELGDPNFYYGQISAKPAEGKWVYFENQFVFGDVSGDEPIFWVHANGETVTCNTFSDHFKKGPLKYTAEVINKVIDRAE